jgi:anti-sigma B factor antagonist
MTVQDRVSGGPVDAAHPALGFHIVMNSSKNGVVEITVAGELDLATSPIFREMVDVCRGRDGVTTLIVDVRELSFIDATGLSALRSARETMQESGGELYLREPTEVVEHILTVTKLQDAFAIIDCD